MKAYSCWQEIILYAPMSKLEVVGMILAVILILWWIL